MLGDIQVLGLLVGGAKWKATGYALKGVGLNLGPWALGCWYVGVLWCAALTGSLTSLQTCMGKMLERFVGEVATVVLIPPGRCVSLCFALGGNGVVVGGEWGVCVVVQWDRFCSGCVAHREESTEKAGVIIADFNRLGHDEDENEHVSKLDGMHTNLQKISRMIGTVHLSFPMDQWIVDLQELVGKQLRSLSSVHEGCQLRKVLAKVIATLESKDVMELSDIDLLNGFFTRHANCRSAFHDDRSQNAISLLIDEACRFEIDHCKGAPAMNLQVTMVSQVAINFQTEAEKAKCNFVLGSESLEIQKHLYTLMLRREGVDAIKNGKLLDVAWDSTVGGMRRVAGESS